MLDTLTIENFAIIDQLTIDFTEGMTVLSGETGAGKSIIIDALGILCGGRGSSDYIRQDSDKLMIEGLFSFEQAVPALKVALASFGIEADLMKENLIIRREININGKNTIRINGQLANVTLLKTIGSFLVDIHGQNEHQDLLDKSKHLEMLDNYAGHKIYSIKEKYTVAYNHYQAMRNDWMDANQNDTEQKQRLGFLEFQISEIEAANIVEDEDTELEAISQKLQNAQTIAENIASINVLFSEADDSLLVQMHRIIDALEEIKAYDESYPTILESLESIRFELEEYAHQLASSNNLLDSDNQSLNEVESRLAELSQLKRKYAMSISEIMDYYHEISEEVYQIINRDRYLEDLEGKFKAAYQQALDLAQELHQIRQEVATELVTDIENELQDLFMENSRFSIHFDNLKLEKLSFSGQTENWLKLHSTGFDSVEFYVSTNIGEGEKALIHVASGGELSRFMLALKTVFSRQSLSKVMVFDEIDTGVSGRVAKAIAEKIKEVSTNHQVLCITHLPQVAAISDWQLYIQKRVTEGRTATMIKQLSLEERSEIIAMMISGRDITQNSLRMSQELLEEYHPAI